MSHEALFDSGSHCMFGGDQIFRRVVRVGKSPTGDGSPTAWVSVAGARPTSRSSSFKKRMTTC
jgi:hypothetical protein